MSEYLHLTEEQAGRLEKALADNVAALSVDIRVAGVWRVAWAVRFATVATKLRLIDRARAGLWVTRAAGRLRAQTRIGRRGRWTDAGPIGLDGAIEVLTKKMSAIEQRRAAR